MRRDAKESKDFFNLYGEREWQRLDSCAYYRIVYLLHLDFIRSLIGPGRKILDAGCGAGRYSIELARRGCEVTLLDISDVQLAIRD